MSLLQQAWFKPTASKKKKFLLIWDVAAEIHAGLEVFNSHLFLIICIYQSAAIAWV